MLLKSIKLENFRQFRNDSIDFAQGEDDKNVTIIIGENGTGKTTFAQAFFWCLYGEANFTDKVILNKIEARKLSVGEEAQVKVTLCLKHGELEYTLIRKQIYYMSGQNRIKSNHATFEIDCKNSDGNTLPVKTSECESIVNSILPKELSSYFFFDGEKIERMSKDISNTKKSSDFAEAVKGLLGLQGMDAAKSHLGPNLKNSVIGQFTSEFDSTSNNKISYLQHQIEDDNIQLTKSKERIDGFDSEIKIATQRKQEKTEEIKQYKEGANLQKEREKITKSIKQVKSTQSDLITNICKDFNNDMGAFFSIPLIEAAIKLIDKSDFKGKDIPAINEKTIKYLLNQGECICGTHLDKGTVPYEKVLDLINYIPPKSISTSISEFKKEARHNVNDYVDQSLANAVAENMGVLSTYIEEYNDYLQELQVIDKKLNGRNIEEKVRKINQDIQYCKKTIQENENKKTRESEKIGAIKQDKDKAEAALRQLTLLDEKNKKTEIAKIYAKRIYDEINDYYDSSEKIVRQHLIDTINEIFKKIYEGGLSLSIDQNYRISVSVNNYEGEVETSTAQSISVIFAFITAIIKLARENRESQDEDAKLMSSEPYPLVMDAPLSTFDKRRIKTVCELLPQAAEQVIIFIKDTDGDLAERYLGSHIGSRHHFEKKNELLTILV